LIAYQEETSYGFLSNDDQPKALAPYNQSLTHFPLTSLNCPGFLLIIEYPTEFTAMASFAGLQLTFLVRSLL